MRLCGLSANRIARMGIFFPEKVACVKYSRDGLSLAALSARTCYVHKMRQAYIVGPGEKRGEKRDAF